MAEKNKVDAKGSRIAILVFVVLIVIGIYLGYQNITGYAIAGEVFSSASPVLSSPPLATGVVLIIALISMVIIAFLSLAGRY